MKKLLTFYFLLILTPCLGQNLVPNGEFEQYTSCPTSGTQFDSLLFWFNPCEPPYGSSGTYSGSPDYFNACSQSLTAGVPNNLWGYQPAYSGDGYSSIALFNNNNTFREYMEVPLTSSLVAGTNYHFEMYISIANKSRYVVDTIGIYLSDSAISGLHSHSPLSYNPQLKINIFTITDTLNWTLISGNFIADGGENFLIIGNFDDDAGTGSLLINSNVGGLYYAYILIDNVSLTPSTGLENYETDARVRIYPNPVTDYLHIELDNINYCQITLYDLAGRIVINETLNNSRILNVSCLTKGSYFFEIKNNNSIIQQGRIFRN